MTKDEAVYRLKNAAWLGIEDDFDYVLEAVNMAVDALSADAVHVVRCKDCKRRWTDGCMMWDKEWITMDDGDGYQDDYYVVHDYTVDDGYCSYGERKGGDDDET